MDRRLFLHAFGLLVAPAAHARTAPDTDWARRLSALEADVGGRLGVAVQGAGTPSLAGHRLHERFPMCSTFKWLGAAVVLARVDAGQASLSARVPVRPDDLLEHAPATGRHVGGSMTVGELCEAAVALSDNPAANLLLAGHGGPAAVTAFARAQGDGVTRLDRMEPALNESAPGDVRDTTSPAAMAHLLRKVVLGNALSPASRAQLATWMQATSTGGERLRKHLPADWMLAEKTGTGRRGTTNDVGVYQAPGGGVAPLTVTAYLTDCDAPMAQRNAVIAAVGQAAVARALRGAG